MIELQGITKSFGSLQVLKGIDLTIDKGEVVSIVGPSGAGKTTLLQIMGTLDKPDTGRILLNGTEINRLKERELAAFRNREIGFVFQFHQLLPEFTALENVTIPALIQGVSSGEARRRAVEMLEFMGLSERASHKPAELSGGEKQRISIARSLLKHSSVLLVDEATASLDRQNAHEIVSDILEIKDVTRVVVTHSLEDSLLKRYDEIITMKDGRIVEQGNFEKLMERKDYFYALYTVTQ